MTAVRGIVPARGGFTATLRGTAALGRTVTRLRFVALLLAIAPVTPAAVRSQVLLIPDGPAFPDRIESAARAARTNGWTEYWLGFSARRLLRRGTHYGRLGGGDAGRVRLGDLLDGASGTQPDIREDVRRTLDRSPYGSSPEALVERDVGVLIRRNRNGVVEAEVCELWSEVELDGLPLLWIGRAAGPDPIRWLIDRYRESAEGTKEDLLAAVGVQEDASALADFLRTELRDAPSTDVREAAAFWAADRLGVEAAPDLIASAERDPSKDVREAARFVLVRWAEERSGDAGSCNTGPLGATNDAAGDIEVQRAALYAIAELEGPELMAFMAKTARDHPERDIRRAAMYWLAEQEDPAALDVLVELAGIRLR